MKTNCSAAVKMQHKEKSKWGREQQRMKREIVGGKPRPGWRRFSARVSSCLIASSLQLHVRQLTHTLTHRVMGGVRRMRNVLGSAESSANHRQHQQHLPRGDASTSNDGAKAFTRLLHTLTHTDARNERWSSINTVYKNNTIISIDEGGRIKMLKFLCKMLS